MQAAVTQLFDSPAGECNHKARRFDEHQTSIMRPTASQLSVTFQLCAHQQPAASPTLAPVCPAAVRMSTLLPDSSPNFLLFGTPSMRIYLHIAAYRCILQYNMQHKHAQASASASAPTPACWHSSLGAMDMLRLVRSHGCRVAVVSNFDTRLRPLLEMLGVLSEVDVLCCSAEVGAEKPNPRIFEKVTLSNALSMLNCYAPLLGSAVDGGAPSA